MSNGTANGSLFTFSVNTVLQNIKLWQEDFTKKMKEMVFSSPLLNIRKSAPKNM